MSMNITRIFPNCPKCGLPAIPAVFPSLGMLGLQFDCGSIGFSIGEGLAIENEACKEIARLRAKLNAAYVRLEDGEALARINEIA